MAWQIDPTHSQIQFSVRHMMISTVRGRFSAFSAEAEIDSQNLAQSSVSATVQADSVDTGEAQRDGHLKSGDFFDAERYPTISLKSRSVQISGDRASVEVDLTIRDVTLPVVLKGEVSGPAKDPWGNLRVGWSLTGELDREAFGLTWNQALETGGVLVAKKVKLEIEAQFIEQK